MLTGSYKSCLQQVKAAERYKRRVEYHLEKVRKHHSLLPIRFHFFFRILSNVYVGSMFRMRRLHLTRSCASSPDNSLSEKSFLMLSNHPRFGLPVLLFAGTSITITLLPTYSSSLLNTFSFTVYPKRKQSFISVRNLCRNPTYFCIQLYFIANNLRRMVMVFKRPQ